MHTHVHLTHKSCIYISHKDPSPRYFVLILSQLQTPEQHEEKLQSEFINLKSEGQIYIGKQACESTHWSDSTTCINYAPATTCFNQLNLCRLTWAGRGQTLARGPCRTTYISLSSDRHAILHYPRGIKKGFLSVIIECTDQTRVEALSLGDLHYHFSDRRSKKNTMQLVLQ